MENEVIAQICRNLAVRIQRRAEEPAIGATVLLIQLAQQPERQDGLTGGFGSRFGLVEISIPKQF